MRSVSLLRRDAGGRAWRAARRGRPATRRCVRPTATPRPPIDDTGCWCCAAGRCRPTTSGCWPRSPPRSRSPTASGSSPRRPAPPSRWPSPTGSGPRCSTRSATTCARPIASAKAAVSSLRAADVAWTRGRPRRAARPPPTTRWTGSPTLVTNLLDLSRLQAGVLPVLSAPVGLDDVVPRARRAGRRRRPRSTSTSRPTCPRCWPTPGLLERVVANLVAERAALLPPGTGADRRQRPRRPGRAAGHRPRARHRPAEVDAVFEPFQRRGRLPAARRRRRARAGDRPRLHRGDGRHRDPGGDSRRRRHAGGQPACREGGRRDPRPARRGRAHRCCVRSP